MPSGLNRLVVIAIGLLGAVSVSGKQSRKLGIRISAVLGPWS